VHARYVLSFPLALVVKGSAARTAVAVIGGSVGGVAAGFLWSAQGAYFAASARLYAQTSHGVTPEQATASFAARFAALFLGSEVILKVLPLGLAAIETALHIGPKNASAVSVVELLPPPPPPPSPPHSLLSVTDITIAILYSVCALVSAFGMGSIIDLVRFEADLLSSSMSNGSVSVAVEDEAAIKPPQAQADGPSTSAAPPPRPRLTSRRLAAAVLLWCKSPAVLLLAPIQATFGVCAALLSYEIAGKVVKHKFLHDNAIAASLLSALVALIAAGLQYPFKLVSSRVGKPPLMITGLGAFVSLAALILALDEEALQRNLPLVACYVLQGIGRACYEGTNKALYADFFPDDAEAAFSNIVLSNGAVSAVAYFVFPNLCKADCGREQMASAALGFSVLAIVCYGAAEAVHRCDARQRSLN